MHVSGSLLWVRAAASASLGRSRSRVDTPAGGVTTNGAARRRQPVTMRPVVVLVGMSVTGLGGGNCPVGTVFHAPPPAQAGAERCEDLDHVAHQVVLNLSIFEDDETTTCRCERSLDKFDVHAPETVTVLDHHRRHLGVRQVPTDLETAAIYLRTDRAEPRHLPPARSAHRDDRPN